MKNYVCIHKLIYMSNGKTDDALIPTIADVFVINHVLLLHSPPYSRCTLNMYTYM